jgi:hypothetical protein
MEDLGTLKTRLVTSAVKLCLEHDMKQSDIYDAIRDALIEKVKDLPKQRVLYNAQHGGFGFSKEFNAFDLKDEHETVSYRDYERRQIVIPYIIPFAEHIINSIYSTHPYFKDMLYIIHKYNLNKVFANIAQISKVERDLALMLRNAMELKEYLGQEPVIPETPSTVSHWLLMFVKTNFSRYTPQDLQGLLEDFEKGELQKPHTETISKLTETTKQLVPEQLFLEMKQFYLDGEEKKEEANTKTDYRLSYIEKDRNTFTKLLAKYGLQHSCTWSFQNYYNTYAISFMFSMYNKVVDIYLNNDANNNLVFDVIKCKHVEVDESVLMNAKETFGLLCASSTYAQLRIAEVPAQLEWNILEYDGLEKVQTV